MPEHTHCQVRTHDRRRLGWVLMLIGIFFVAEVVGGWLANSLALLADAAHMFSDVGAVGLGWLALWLAQRPATSRRTYGYQRAEILVAFVNGLTLFGMAGSILFVAISRLQEPPEVQGGLMLSVASGGLLVNLLALWILHGDENRSLNMRGVWLHVLGDTLGSVAAITAGVMIWTLDWRWFDPVASLLIAMLLSVLAGRLVLEALNVLMENAPRKINVDTVAEAIGATPGVCGLHDLHVWTITSGFDALTAHVVHQADVDSTALLASLRTMLQERFGLIQITVQLEQVGTDDLQCPRAPA